MRFSDPIYLILAPLIIGFIWWSGRHMLGVDRARRRFSMLLRSFVILLLTLALAGWQMNRPNTGVATLFLLDHSESVPEPDQQSAADFVSLALKKIGSQDKAGVVVFGRDALVDISPIHIKDLPPIYSSPDRQGTDLAGAIRLASALFPDGYSRRIVLLSDGNETQSDARSAAQVAAVDHIEIDAVPLRPLEQKKEVLVARLETPGEAKTGEPFEVKTIIESQANTEGTLIIDRDGVPVKRMTVSLSPGKNVILTSIGLDKAGAHRLRATLEAQPDQDPRNNVGMGVVSVRGKPRVLLAEGAPDPTAALNRALSANQIEVDKIGPNEFPSRPEDLQAYDAILFSDYPAENLTSQQMVALESAVRDTGIGFMMIGGMGSFQTGGYYATPIAEMLPVDMELKHRKIYHASTVLLIIDSSGSMNQQVGGGMRNVHIAAEAAIQTLRMLRPMDRFGVIASSHGSDWLTPDMAVTKADPFGCDGRNFEGCHGARAGQPLAAIYDANQRDKIIQVLNRVYGTGGGIFMRGSLEMARRGMLTEPPTRSRHVLILADANDCDEQEGSREVVQQLRAAGVTTSIIAFGQGKDVTYLKWLAKEGGGNFYLCQDARHLPRIFTADVSTMTRAAIEEGAFLPKIASRDERIESVDWNRVPPLMAYNLLGERPLAQTLLKTHKEDPLLASWQYGLGTVAAFTSDAKPKWAQRWMGWSDFSIFWTQQVRSVLRKGGRNQFALNGTIQNGKGVVEMQAFSPEGEAMNLPSPQVQVATPSGKSFAITLQQQGAGKYRGEFELGETGTYLLSSRQTGPDGKPSVLTTGLALPYPPEYQFTRPNEPLMKQVAQLTGGQFEPEPGAAFRPLSRSDTSMRELWQPALSLAMLLLLADITLRRLALSMPKAFGLIWEAIMNLRLPHRAPAQTRQATERLQQAKSRAGTRRSDSPSPAPVNRSEASAQPPPASAPAPRSEESKPAPSSRSNPEQKTLSRLLDKKRQREDE